MKREKFEQLVEEALASIPKKFKKRLQNLAVIVEDIIMEYLSDIVVLFMAISLLMSSSSIKNQ